MAYVTYNGMLLFTALLGCEFHFYMCFLKCSELLTIASGDNPLTVNIGLVQNLNCYGVEYGLIAILTEFWIDMKLYSAHRAARVF